MASLKRGTPTRTERSAQREMSDAQDRRLTARHTGTMRFRSAATLVATVALIALLAGVFAILRRPAGPTTGSQPTIQFNLPPNSQLSAISMTSSGSGWAVGTVNNQPNGLGGAKSVLLAHFDGHAWTASPDAAHLPAGSLVSVSMTSAGDGWATGSLDTAGSPTRGLVLHYSGGHWRTVDLSGLGFVGGGQVSMNRSGDGWLIAPVGAKVDTAHKTLVLRYHLGKWSAFGSLPGSDLVSMLSATDGWAVNTDNNTILRYQNGAWSQVATAPGQPLALSMTSSAEGWIGGFNVATQSAFALRFDGSSWSQVALPDATHAEIDQIAAPAVGSVWMFGRAHTNSQASPTQALATVAWRFSAGHWTMVNLNFQADPSGASMASATSGWIIGNATGNTAALLRYNNGAWTDAYYGK